MCLAELIEFYETSNKNLYKMWSSTFQEKLLSVVSYRCPE